MKNQATLRDEPVLIWTGVAMLEGRLVLPDDASSLVLVASPAATAANFGYHRIGNHLAHHGFGVLYADVLTEDEEQFDSRTGHFRYDMPLLASRISGILDWIARDKSLSDLSIVFVGSGSIAAAALKVASTEHDAFAALILAEARTDLAADNVRFVQTPTLLIAPDSDLAILRMNRDAADALRCEQKLEILPDSVRIIDDDLNIEQVAHLVLGWAAAHTPVLSAEC